MVKWQQVMACDSIMTIAVRFILKWHSVKNVDKFSSVCKRKIYKCHIICNGKETSGCYLIFNQCIIQEKVISMSILETLNIKQEFKIISFVKSQIQNENGNYQCELDDFFL